MGVTIKQINAFVAIAKSRSFAEASGQLHLSQPALSIAIKNLEEVLGGSLFTRSTRTLELTPEGKVFLPVAQRLLDDLDHAMEDISNLFSLKQGTLSMAAMPFFAASILPDILVSYQSQHPNISIRLHDIVNELVIEEVRSGRVEIGLCFHSGKDEDLEFTPLFSEEFMALLPIDHPLADRDEVNWVDLFNYPFLTLLQPSSIQDTVKKVAKKLDLTFSPYIETHQLSTVGYMIASGLGVGIVPQSCHEQMIKTGAICKKLVNPVISEQVGIIHRKRHALSSAAFSMKHQIIKHYQKDIPLNNDNI